MKRTLRVGLMVLLTAVLGVGNAWGEGKVWTDGNGLQWEYEEIEKGATCSIRPENRSSIRGRVEIPGAVEVEGVSIKVVAIEASAFSGCRGLTAVTISDSVTVIGDFAFQGCSGLKSFEVESGNKNYCAAGGVLFTKDKDTLICYPGGKPEESYTIPGSVTAIERGAFSSCSGLKEVTIPSSVTAIRGYAFSGCSGLTAMIIPNSVTAIEDGAFSGCSGLKAVTIPEGVTRIGESAFSSCSGLTAMTIPSSVTEIEDGAFSGCSGLKSFEVESGNKNYCAESGVLFTKYKTTLICYPGGKTEESYIIPDGVTAIGRRAFKDCSGLKAVTISGRVTEIRGGAFESCSGLKEVTIPDGVKMIGWGAFSGCSELTAVNIPSSVTWIGGSAFSGCSGLKEVTIPSRVTEIEAWAFQDCSGLTMVNIPRSVTRIGESAFSGCSGLTAMIIPSSVTAIGDGAFSGCSGLKLIEVESLNERYCSEKGVLFTEDKATLICYPGGKPEESYTSPSSVTEIGESAFGGCSGLTAVTIPDGVTEIGPYAFKGSKKLKELTIPSSVYKIHRYAFEDCESLNTVYLYRSNDQEFAVDETAFKGIASQATLYVRKVMKEKIKDKPWCKNIFTIEEGYVVTFQGGEGNKLGEQMVKSNGTATEPTAPTREGYIFEGWRLDGAKYDFSTKVVKDITLVAMWKKKDDSGTAVESVQLAGVRVVQNPVGEVLELEGMERAAQVEVYSVAGVRVHAEALRGEPRVVIDARGWASGVYVVKVEASDGAKTLRVVK